MEELFSTARVLFCQGCGQRFLVSGEPGSCDTCGGRLYHQDHPRWRNPGWKPAFYNADDSAFLRTMGINPS